MKKFGETLELRAEVWKDQIAVQLICPGYVQTQISMNAVTGDGSKQQQMDQATAQGIPADRFARKMANAMLGSKPEVYICGAKERAGLYVKRFFPRLFPNLRYLEWGLCPSKYSHGAVLW